MRRARCCSPIPRAFGCCSLLPTGKLVSSWGQFGSDASSMNLPTGIAVDAQGRIYVADSENHRVLRFAP